MAFEKVKVLVEQLNEEKGEELWKEGYDQVLEAEKVFERGRAMLRRCENDARLVIVESKTEDGFFIAAGGAQEVERDWSRRYRRESCVASVEGDEGRRQREVLVFLRETELWLGEEVAKEKRNPRCRRGYFGR